jgi:hypothetical protein
MGRAEWPLGRCEESIAHMDRNDGRSQLGTLIGPVRQSIALIFEKQYSEAEEAGLGYRPYVPYAFLAAIQAAKGNDAAAKSALAEARRLNPQLTIKWFKTSLTI